MQARIEKLETQNVIAGYTIKLGESVDIARIKATVLVQLQPRYSAQVMQRLKSIPEVEVVHSSSGRFDLVLQLAAGTTRRLDDVLDEIRRIDGVRSSESLIHLSTKFDRQI